MCTELEVGYGSMEALPLFATVGGFASGYLICSRPTNYGLKSRACNVPFGLSRIQATYRDSPIRSLFQETLSPETWQVSK